MEYKDYDTLLKYEMFIERLKSVYLGNPNIYEDGKTLEIFPENQDHINKTEPLFVFGTTVYLKYGDKVLMLKQNKEDRVVDTLVGLGGKVRPVFGRIIGKSEKTDIYKILRALETGDLKTEEEMRQAAAREVWEETSTYKKDSKGIYTHEIIYPGLPINRNALRLIGPSRIRIINSSKTECWMILNYIYELSEKEFDFIEKSISKTNREGILCWYKIDDILKNMSNSDNIMLNNCDKDVEVSEIRDNVNNQNIVRFVININDKTYSGTIINGKLVYFNDEKTVEIVNNVVKK